MKALARAAGWMVLTTSALGAGLFACDEVYADPVTTPPFSPFSGLPDAGLTSTRTPPIACPQTAEENGPCSGPGAVCEYGSSPDPQCNRLFACTADSYYGAFWAERQFGSCAAVCPDPAQIVDGAPCDLGDAGAGPEAELHCTTPLGTCACTTGRDGAHAHPRRWVCKKVEEGCPAARPMLGQPCFGQRSCDYGACEFKRGSRMFCEDEVWQTEITECAD